MGPTDRYQKINFHAVGAALNVKQNTAYKRYASLVKAFEDTDEPEDKTGTAEAVTPKSTKPKKAVTKDGNAAGSKKRKNDGMYILGDVYRTFVDTSSCTAIFWYLDRVLTRIVVIAFVLCLKPSRYIAMLIPNARRQGDWS